MHISYIHIHIYNHKTKHALTVQNMKNNIVYQQKPLGLEKKQKIT